jgi:L,D-transpeptidase YcbB
MAIGCALFLNLVLIFSVIVSMHTYSLIHLFMKRYLYMAILGSCLLLPACTKNKGTDLSNQPTQTSVNQKETLQRPPYDREEARKLIRQWVDSTTVDQELPEINEKKVAAELTAFYESRDFAPAWGVSTAQELLDAVNRLNREGLEISNFPVDELSTLLDSLQQKDLTARTGARLDLLLSATYLKVARTLATGKIDPSDLAGPWYIKPKAPDTLFTHLQQAVTGEVSASLDSFRPGFGQYSRLLNQVKKYNDIMENGGWPEVAEGPELAPGDSSARMATIRERLFATGDLTVPPSQWREPARYDSSLIEAVNAFQTRYGLAVQPEITSDMEEAMNVPVEKRIRQLKLNLDRIRWISTGPMPETFVMVNVPEFRLHVVENGQEIKLMKVVVGKVLNSTPVFKDRIEYVEFSPYWNVPNSIASEEIWPKIRRNRSYLSRNHYEVLNGWGAGADVVSLGNVNWGNLDSYRIRQKPGPWNALGQVKFMFPNQYAIYLHDTPSEHLFDKNYRAFSHGCIRIEEPAWFADWILPQLSRAEVEEKMTNRQREVVQLDQEIPVYIVYLTTFVDKAGRLNFRPDLYEMDERMEAEFAQAQ